MLSRGGGTGAGQTALGFSGSREASVAPPTTTATTFGMGHASDAAARRPPTGHRHTVPALAGASLTYLPDLRHLCQGPNNLSRRAHTLRTFTLGPCPPLPSRRPARTSSPRSAVCASLLPICATPRTVLLLCNTGTRERSLY